LGPVYRTYHYEPDRLVPVKMVRLELLPDRLQQLVSELQKLITK
jgi:hypothetical protein